MTKAICPHPSVPPNRASAIARLRAAFLAAALLPALITSWLLWLAPIGDLAANRTAVAARDFTALWAAGRLARAGATAILADPARFTLQLRQWFGPGMPAQIWPYPPPTLLLAEPVAHLPLGSSFLVYCAVTLLLLWLVLRLAHLPSRVCTLVLLSPAVADNLLIGQNGAITAALLSGGLLFVESRPLLGGALLGALVIKPQMALLVPFYLVGGSRWRAAAAALTMSIGLIFLSWLCFGASAWVDYLVTARPAIATYLETNWDPQSAQRIFASAFTAARSVGADLVTAYAFQAVVTALCAMLAFQTGRQSSADPRRRMAYIVALTCAASPWIHSYDMAALAVAIAIVARDVRSEHLPWLALAWCWPGILTVLRLPDALLLLSTVSIAWLAWRNVHDHPLDPYWNPLRCAS